MKWLTLNLIKQQLRIDGNAEDALLEMYGEGAEETVLNYINRDYDDLVDTFGCVPIPIKHASLMLVDVSYQYRSPISPSSVSVVPYTFDVLVKPYMRLSDLDYDEINDALYGSDNALLCGADRAALCANENN